MTMVWVLGVMLACTSGPDSSDRTEQPSSDHSLHDTSDTATTDTDDTPSTGELTVTVEVTDVPTVLRVLVTSPTEASAYVSFGRDGALDRQTPMSPPDTEHEFLLLGLPAGSDVSLQVHAGSLQSEVLDGKLGPKDPQLPRLELIVPAGPTSQVAGNYVMFAGPERGATSPTATMYVTIVNDRGEYVWWKRLPENWGTSAAMPSRDGRSIYWNEVDNFREDPHGRIVRYTLDGTLVSETAVNEAHHVALELDDGTFAFLGHTYHDGRNAGHTWVMTDDVRIVPEGGAEEDAVQIFSIWDDMFGGRFENIPEEAAVCEDHVLSIFGRRDICEATHTNSLTFDPESQAFSIMVRWLDAVVTMDRSGKLLWQMSGPWSDFTTTEGEELWIDPENTLLWSYPHFSQTWTGGMMMFDNAVNDGRRVSAFSELVYDVDEGTVEELFRYEDPNGGFTNSMGDARKLSGGNYLSSWMQLEYMAEISPQGEEVWRLQSGQAIRRVHLLEDLYDLTDVGAAYP